ncbi:MAG: TIGR03620 family F420-dependent LLM class oxidoreductase [Holophagales bacterium]|nr:TIGR03620 family F420-dependent LLM class oxidoreductase [Holophagales bacterium]MYH23947.1 TIGR03620 family F420-dependent LLM class oxidoreductase [Holophagales bacterium]
MTESAHNLGRLGVWAGLDGLSAPQAAEFAVSIEAQGYGALWTPEAIGRDPFALVAYLGARTERITHATGIANIYARDAMTTKAVHKTLSEMLPGRFVLGLGVSHPHLVTNLRGHEYKPPVPKMREYLEAVGKAFYRGPEPVQEAPIVIAALRPLMLKLAATDADGAHPYLVTPEHTRQAREIMGDGPLLCPEQKVILTTDAEAARKIGRANLYVYLRAPNYQNSLLELGYTEDDWQEFQASDRLVDALVAWGTEDQVRERIQAHWDAGADHVCIQAFRPDGKPGADLDALAKLAPGR